MVKSKFTRLTSSHFIRMRRTYADKPCSKDHSTSITDYNNIQLRRGAFPMFLAKYLFPL
jgi:hypothetical protein